MTIDIHTHWGRARGSHDSTVHGIATSCSGRIWHGVVWVGNTGREGTVRIQGGLGGWTGLCKAGNSGPIGCTSPKTDQCISGSRIGLRRIRLLFFRLTFCNTRGRLLQGGAGAAAGASGKVPSQALLVKGMRALRPRPGRLAPPPQLVVVPSWAMSRWYMELAQCCPRLVIKVSRSHYH